MKNLIVMIIITLIGLHARSGVKGAYTPPENGKITVATLSGSYGCEKTGEFKPLNLNGETYQNGNYYPDLQINFACGSEPKLEGTDYSLIAQIGNVKLEELVELKALAPSWTVGYSHDFRRSAPIVEGMTYSLVLNTFKYRGLLVFKVISYKENILTIEYATRYYSLINETLKSDYIGHDAENFR